MHTETFNVKDLDKDRLISRSKAEAIKIYAKKSTRNGRNLNEIIKTCMKGHSAELFLIDKCGYTDNFNDYMDLYTPGGSEVEIKVTEKLTNIYFILEALKKRRLSPWANVADKVYIYLLNNETGDVRFINEYTFNGQEYVLLD